ncbi:hypothetical protein [Acidisoma sp. S159]|uniref:hypothetical protein n=1 Tax=Acidisoma sp. S159 TaxID=1747225 RepID=UPI00131BD27D|nr:hypothetical protein [Acidisoma sp. S159]
MDQAYYDLTSWLDTVKQSVGLLKAAASLLPKGSKRDDLEFQIRMAAESLERSDLKLAKELGARFCYCTPLPTIMLWKETKRAFICPNPECGSEKKKRPTLTAAPPFMGGNQEPNGWMDR